MITAVVAALCSAAGFAVSTSLQHRAVTWAPPASGRAVPLLAYLVRRPAWLLGQIIGVVGFGLHALAVRYGALALVQPLMVSGMVFAVAVRAALDRRVPSRYDVVWAGVVATGLAIFVIVSDPPTATGTSSEAPAAGAILGGVVLVGLCLWGVRQDVANRTRGLLFGTASGVLFGLVAGTLKMSVLSADQGALILWPVLVLPLLGGSGVLLNQRAYQVSPLSVSMPILNIVNVLVSIAFGLFVFDEVPAHGAGHLAAEVLGLALMAIGVRWLARGTSVVPVETAGTDPISGVSVMPDDAHGAGLPGA